MSVLGKIVGALIALTALTVFLIVVDFGISAGRIHEGVQINRLDVGGLTREEALELLDARAEELEDSPVVFRLEGHSDVFEFTPSELDWQARVPRTIDEAMSVGRTAGLGAVVDRARAWLSDVRVLWRGTVDQDAVSALIDEWETRGDELGVQIDRWRLRWKIKRAIVLMPRKELVIPIAS
jgi:hypothetical protein